MFATALSQPNLMAWMLPQVLSLASYLRHGPEACLAPVAVRGEGGDFEALVEELLRQGPRRGQDVSG